MRRHAATHPHPKLALCFLLTAGLAASLAGCSPLPASGAEVTATMRIVVVQSTTQAPADPGSVATQTPAEPTVQVLAATALAALPTVTTLPLIAPTATPTPAPQPLPTPDEQAASRRVRLPILMYHYVEPWPSDAGELRQGLTVKPEDFAAQVDYLHSHGYTTVSLYDLVNALALGQPLPEKSVVLTFDDGYRTLMDYALPVLEPYGYTGTVFVLTQLMDERFPQYLTWEQAESLYARGWKIEPHTKTHDQLAGRNRDFQLYQMLGSQQTVAGHIGTLPRFFAYPSGQYDELSIQIAREMNLWGAVTVDFGREHTINSLFTLRRVRISGTGTLADFANLLEGGAAD